MASTMHAAAEEHSSYDLYWQADFNRPDYYPIEQTLDARWYRPAASWLGRLILPSPEIRREVMGALLEVYHAPEPYQKLVGQIVWLRWAHDPQANARFWGVTRQVIFNEQSKQFVADGFVLPERLNNLPLVNPFESLAGAHPHDDIVVRLPEPVEVEVGEGKDGSTVLYIPQQPVQTTGRYYALVRFAGRVEEGSDHYTVAHYDAATQSFDGLTEVVRLPDVVPNKNGVYPAMNTGIERSPGNELGWYIYGAQDADGMFVVQSLVPRGLVRVVPDLQISGTDLAEAYLKPAAWKEASDKGTFSKAFLCPSGADADALRQTWREGETVLLIHLYGGIGGNKKEKFAAGPFYWGHFAFGTATIVHEPLADEPAFDIVYHQVYVQNPDGITSGAHHYTRYAGDRQYGWLGTRPLQEILVKLDSFTEPFDFGEIQRSALNQMVYHLEVMTARYRIADGRGGIRVTAANNCAQDSNQALYAAIKEIDHIVNDRADILVWRSENPAEAKRMDRLIALGHDLRKTLLPWGTARADWEWGAATLGSSLTQNQLKNLSIAVRSWRTLFPSVTVRALAKVFLNAGASLWILRTNQVGGDDPDIEPVIPNL